MKWETEHYKDFFWGFVSNELCRKVEHTLLASEDVLCLVLLNTSAQLCLLSLDKKLFPDKFGEA